MPLSLVDENFKRARTSNAILTEKFWWRKNILDEGPAQMEEMTLDEIFFGSPSKSYEGIYVLIF
jgi:glutamate--cysteine ligase catalytic subunit